MIKTPYLLFLGDAPDALSGKVAQGIKDWRPDVSVGQLRLEGCRADMSLTDMSVDEALAAGAQTLVIGVANRGGVISEAWKAVLLEALEKGLDLACQRQKTQRQALSCGGHGLLRGQDVHRYGHGPRDGAARHEVDLSRHGPDRDFDRG